MEFTHCPLDDKASALRGPPPICDNVAYRWDCLATCCWAPSATFCALPMAYLGLHCWVCLLSYVLQAKPYNNTNTCLCNSSPSPA
eukprot:17590-Chlamydomonas_euryale.AAC.4